MEAERVVGDGVFRCGWRHSYAPSVIGRSVMPPSTSAALDASTLQFRTRPVVLQRRLSIGATLIGGTIMLIIKARNIP